MSVLVVLIVSLFTTPYIADAGGASSVQSSASKVVSDATVGVRATEGETAFLQCNTSAAEPVAPVDWKIRIRTQSGLDLDDYIFMYNGVQNDDYKPRFTLSLTTLVIYNVSVDDSGIYFCVEDSGKGVINTITLSVQARDAGGTIAVQPSDTDSTDATTAAKQGTSPAWEKIIVTLFVILILIVATFAGVKLWKRLKSPKLKRLELRELLPPGENALPLIVDVTTEPCCFTDESSRRKRAKMPCGHVISPEALKTKCLMDVNLYRLWQIRCSLCQFVWDFAMIRHVLRTIMKSAMLNEIAKRMSENFLQQRDKFRECPRCQFLCERIIAESSGCANPDKVICVVCTVKNKDQPVEFCWRCLRPWASTGGTTAGSACGNADCSVDIVSPENIAAFPDQRMGNVSRAPGIRACPGCRFFVSLAADGYKHVKCAACKLEFCFVCLREKDGEGRWPCSECDGPCEPAALQPEFLNRLIDILNRPTEQPTANNNSS